MFFVILIRKIPYPSPLCKCDVSLTKRCCVPPFVNAKYGYAARQDIDGKVIFVYFFDIKAKPVKNNVLNSALGAQR